MNYVKNKYEAFRESKREQAEQDRVQRNLLHPHKDECRQTLDIEVFDRKYEHSDLDMGGAWGTGPSSILVDYKTRCQECGTCSNMHGHDRREKKNRASDAYSIKRLADIQQGNVLEDGLTDELVEVVASAFGAAPADTAEHLQGDLMLIARDKQGKAAGFASLDYASPAELFEQTADLPKIGGYFAAAAVSEKHQKHALYHLFTEGRLHASLERRLPYVFTRTQNPAVELGMKAELELAQEEGKIASFSLERRFVPECYGQQLAKKQPRIPAGETQKAFTQLDTKAGDAYILVFHLTYPRKESR